MKKKLLKTVDKTDSLNVKKLNEIDTTIKFSYNLKFYYLKNGLENVKSRTIFLSFRMGHFMERIRNVKYQIDWTLWYKKCCAFYSRTLSSLSPSLTWIHTHTQRNQICLILYHQLHWNCKTKLKFTGWGQLIHLRPA